MKMYLVSLGTGILVGAIYSLLSVRSPAPPLVALVGLLGMLVGEQIVPMVKQFRAGASVQSAWRNSNCTDHVFGVLPGAHADARVSPNEEKQR
jgi:XapX domain-containing protein